MEWEDVDWIHQAEARNQWRGVVNGIIYIYIYIYIVYNKTQRIFCPVRQLSASRGLCSIECVSFSRSLLLS